MKKIALITCFLLFSIGCNSQIYSARNGFIGFYSTTPFENVIAENNQVYAIIDLGKKNVAFMLLMKSFVFKKELMQEHFNENYAETDKYPKAVFNGNFTGDFDLKKEGVYKIMVTGNLTLHGVTNKISEPATLEVNGGKLTGQSKFQLKPEDYNISIPSIVRDKIARQIEVNVQVNFNSVK